MAFIFVLSSMSEPPDLPSGMSDKGGHGLLYFGLGALLVRALGHGWGRRISVSLCALAVSLCALYGVTDEIHQYFVPSRQMDVLDLVADTAGAAAAVAALYVWGRSVEGRRSRQRAGV